MNTPPELCTHVVSFPFSCSVILLLLLILFLLLLILLVIVSSLLSVLRSPHPLPLSCLSSSLAVTPITPTIHYSAVSQDTPKLAFPTNYILLNANTRFVYSLTALAVDYKCFEFFCSAAIIIATSFRHGLFLCSWHNILLLYIYRRVFKEGPGWAIDFPGGNTGVPAR